MPYPAAIPIIRYKMNVAAVARRVIQDKQRVRDLRPYWEFLWEAFIIEEIQHIFETEGLGEWERTDFTSSPILQRTGVLFRSYTRRTSRQNINVQRGHYFEFGSQNPYAFYHEEGTVNMEERQVVALLYEQLRGEKGNRQLQELFDAYFSSEEPDAGGAERFVRRQTGRRLRFIGG